MEKETDFFEISLKSGKSCYQWNTDKVVKWLNSVCLEEYIDIFIENEIDGHTLLELTIDDLYNFLKIKSLRKRKILWNEIIKLKEREGVSDFSLALKKHIEELKENNPTDDYAFCLHKNELNNVIDVVKDSLFSSIIDIDNYNILKSEKFINKIISINEKECNSCFEKNINVINLPCSHIYCDCCMRNLFLLSLNDISLLPVRCCKIEVDINMAKELLTRDDFNKLCMRYLEQITINKIYCPNKLCSQLIILDKINFIENIVCPNCLTILCYECKNIEHPFLTCLENQNNTILDEDKEFNTLVINEDWKTCPKCRSVIELIMGCYHIICICKYEFCYICKKEWSNPTCINGCPLWDNKKLYEHANRVRVKDEIDREELIIRMRDQECFHVWKRVNEGNNYCMNCNYYMNIYLNRCSKCYMEVCYTCRYHRM
jgi:hypothetical protein